MKMHNLEEKFWRWLSRKLPRKLVYFALIRAIAFGTGGVFGSTLVADLNVMECAKRWERAIERTISERG